MMCFRDMTFCPFHKDCAESKDCGRAETEDVIKEATEWWGGPDFPICVYSAKPDCHKKEETK